MSQIYPTYPWPRNTKHNLVNFRFGKLIVLSEAERLKQKNVRWLCKCDCGKETTVRAQALKSGEIKSCGCMWYRGVEDLSSTYFSQILNGAKHRDLEFSITKEYLWSLFLKQDKKCALSGIDINLDKHYGKRLCTQTASLDRIDSLKGYTEENVQWVHKDVNTMKMDLSETKFFEFISLIYKHKKLTDL